ncbi:MAG: cupin domain-containing protein [Bacteroidia bacterium]|nr:cupin domain-containing protein [Bacteroidia bacterium]
MATGIEKHIVHSELMDWKPLKEEGVDTRGIFYKALRFDEQQNRAPSFLLKFEPGASYPYHNHPGGEEVFVLEGEVYFNEGKLTRGDYLYTPPGYKHAVRSEVGCVLLFNVPEEVEIIHLEH